VPRPVPEPEPPLEPVLVPLPWLLLDRLVEDKEVDATRVKSPPLLCFWAVVVLLIADVVPAVVPMLVPVAVPTTTLE
jgi:hypothetical protein